MIKIIHHHQIRSYTHTHSHTNYTTTTTVTPSLPQPHHNHQSHTTTIQTPPPCRHLANASQNHVSRVLGKAILRPDMRGQCKTAPATFTLWCGVVVLNGGVSYFTWWWDGWLLYCDGCFNECMGEWMSCCMVEKDGWMNRKDLEAKSTVGAVPMLCPYKMTCSGFKLYLWKRWCRVGSYS